MKRWFWLLGCCLLLGLASGCAPIQTSVADLLDAPRLTERQGQVLEALRDEVGQDIKLKYPKSGEYRSAFTFYDIDGDGSEEAIVLYSVRDGGRQVSRVVVLDDQSGRWQAVGPHIPGLGTDIDFIRFEKMRSSGPDSMIVGWIPEGSERSVAIYSYGEEGFSLEYAEAYSRIGIGDFNQDGLHELLLFCAPDTGAMPYVILTGEDPDGYLDTLDLIQLDDRVLSFLEPVCGVVSADGLRGAALDVLIRPGTMATAIVQVVGSQLRSPTLDQDSVLFFESYRTTGVRSGDINGDGIIEIPLQADPGGQDQLEEAARVYYTDYVQLQGQVWRPVTRAYVNVEQGYRVILPPQWQGESGVRVRRLQENSEVVFFLPQEEEQPDIELLRIRVGDSQGYPDKLETKHYFVIQQRGAFQYYVWLPEEDTGDAPVITREQLEGLFSLLS